MATSAATPPNHLEAADRRLRLSFLLTTDEDPQEADLSRKRKRKRGNKNDEERKVRPRDNSDNPPCVREDEGEVLAHKESDKPPLAPEVGSEDLTRDAINSLQQMLRLNTTPPVVKAAVSFSSFLECYHFLWTPSEATPLATPTSPSTPSSSRRRYSRSQSISSSPSPLRLQELPTEKRSLPDCEGGEARNRQPANATETPVERQPKTRKLSHDGVRQADDKPTRRPRDSRGEGKESPCRSTHQANQATKRHTTITGRKPTAADKPFVFHNFQVCDGRAVKYTRNREFVFSTRG